MKDTLEKANHIKGLGPITDTSLETHRRSTRDFERAKVLAVQDFLTGYLKFNSEELEDMNITQTSISAKKDKVVYVAFNNTADIYEIRLRIAECKNRDIIARNFVPPQIYYRYMFLSKICTQLRSSDDTIKTQLRFSQTDVDILTKTKGTEDPFKSIPLSHLTEVNDIPKYDHTRNCKHRVDIPPRRKVIYSSKDRNMSPSPSPTRQKTLISPPTRQNSTDNPRKKQKTQTASPLRICWRI